MRYRKCKSITDEAYTMFRLSDNIPPYSWSIKSGILFKRDINYSIINDLNKTGVVVSVEPYLIPVKRHFTILKTTRRNSISNHLKKIIKISQKELLK